MKRVDRSVMMKDMRARLAIVLGCFASLGVVAVGCDAENSLVDGDCVLPNCEVPPGSSGSSGGDGATDGNRDGNGDGATDGNGDGNGDGCVPPFVTPENCGACGVQCTAPNTACIVDPNGNAVCSLPCTPPLIACQGKCIDVSSDPFNCGACGKVCPSNICVMGKCQGATPGDVVAIGHDYQNAFAGSSQSKILTNAVFIPTSNPLRVLSYEQFADPTVASHVKSLINAGAGGRMVQYSVQTAPAALASATLADNFDVVLVHDQPNASAATLTTNGTTWAPSLNTFAKAGGVIVVLDGGSGQGAMPSLLVAAQLIDVPTHANMPAGSLVGIVAPADRVGNQVVGPYGSADRSVTFQSNEPNGGNLVWVARRSTGGVFGDPVVLHKSVP